MGLHMAMWFAEGDGQHGWKRGGWMVTKEQKWKKG